MTATEYTKTTEDIQQQVSVISAISVANHAAFAIASRGVARVTSPGPRARLSRRESKIKCRGLPLVDQYGLREPFSIRIP